MTTYLCTLCISSEERQDWPTDPVMHIKTTNHLLMFDDDISRPYLSQPVFVLLGA